MSNQLYLGAKIKPKPGPGILTASVGSLKTPVCHRSGRECRERVGQNEILTSLYPQKVVLSTSLNSQPPAHNPAWTGKMSFASPQSCPSFTEQVSVCLPQITLFTWALTPPTCLSFGWIPQCPLCGVLGKVEPYVRCALKCFSLKESEPFNLFQPQLSTL